MLHAHRSIDRMSRRLGLALAASRLARFPCRRGRAPGRRSLPGGKAVQRAAKMRDGVTLYADVYRPKAAAAIP